MKKRSDLYLIITFNNSNTITMKMLKSIADGIASIITALLFGLFLAYLRNKHRWLYYPLKWITTIMLCFMLGAFFLVVFKLGCEIIGIKVNGGDIVDSLSSGGLTGMAIWLLVMGSFITAYVDYIVYLIERNIFNGTFYIDSATGKPVNVVPKIWNPTPLQSIIWNLYGFGIVIFLWFRAAS